VFSSLVNRNYEGEISQMGDSVKINQIGDISISDYGSTGLGTPGQLSDAGLTLTIDQAKAFKFRVEDIDKMQATPGVMDEAMRKAGVAVANVVDQHLAGLYSEHGYTTSTGNGSTGAAMEVSSTNIAEYVLDMGEEMDKRNVPGDGRWMVVPPWFMRRLTQAHVLFMRRLTQAHVLTGGHYLDDPNSGALKTGKIGSALGFNFYMSNNVSQGSTHYRVMFGTNDAITHASQINKVEAYRPENWFADAVKGLYLYGSKVVKPAALGTLYCYAG